MLEAVADHLEARGASLRGDTIVGATLMAASPSTKNAAGQRDPEIRSYFGKKAHIGVPSGLLHTRWVVTTGNVHDATVMDRLIRDDDTAVYGDKRHASGARKQRQEAAPPRPQAFCGR